MEITTKGQKINAMQWLSWRKEGMRTGEIADMLNITPSMASIIARKFRAAGYPDPFYKKTMPGPPVKLDTDTDTGSYILGILWGAASKVESNYIIRHRDPFFLKTIKDILKLEPVIQKSYSHTRDQYRLKISRHRDILFLDELYSTHGWTKRNDRKRYYPAGPINDKGFIRAWLELHSSVDICRSGRKKRPLSRLRIYGNRLLIQDINEIISANTGLKLRALQKTSNETTKALWYTGSSAKDVFNWLYQDAEIFNPNVREKIMDVLKKALS